MAAIKISNSDRVAFIGSTGSGKTQLAKHFLSRLNRVVVIDPKHMFKLDGFKKSNWNPPRWRSEFKLIIRPRASDDEELFDYIRALYKIRNLTIYVDEMATLSDMFPLSTAALADIARIGREPRVALWSAMQRPRGTPRIFLSESENFFVFNLRAREDREYIKGYAGDEVIDRIPKFSFWYVKPDDENPDLLTLDLESGDIKTVERSVNNVN